MTYEHFSLYNSVNQNTKSLQNKLTGGSLKPVIF